MIQNVFVCPFYIYILVTFAGGVQVKEFRKNLQRTFSALLAICAVNLPVPGELPAQRPVTQSFDIFFDLRLNNRLSKQSWGWWFETLSRPLLRHRSEFELSMIAQITLKRGHFSSLDAVKKLVVSSKQ